MPTFEVIVAVAKDNVIGYKGQLPWGSLQKDLKHFRDMTMGHAIVIGYNTLVAISSMRNRTTKLLPGRVIYVLTRDPQKLNGRFPDCIGVSDIDSIARIGTRCRIFIAGGEDIYHQFAELPQTRVVHMTRIFAKYHGDTFFPHLHNTEWVARKEVFHPADQKNKHAMSFITLIRSAN